MGTENKSPSYLREREQARRLLTQTYEGQFHTNILRQHAPGGEIPWFDDDNWTDWGGVIEEMRGSLLMASNCAEARRATEIAMHSRYKLAAPSAGQGKWLRFFSPPIWYVMRRQVEVMDPDYWNDPTNVMREALDCPQWTTVPESVIRGELKKYLPRGQGAPNASLQGRIPSEGGGPGVREDLQQAVSVGGSDGENQPGDGDVQL